jgi:uncharacterized protein
MILILASSKTQHASGRQYPVFSQPSLLPDSLHLVEALQQLSAEDFSTLMKLSPRLGEETWLRYRDLRPPFAPDTACQAIFTFAGDSYRAISPETYNDVQLAHAQSYLRILSALYGVLRPLDLIMPYRLEMSYPLANIRGKNLYAYWGRKITDLIERELAATSDMLLVNLASQEYARVIDRKRLGRRMITVVFQENKAGVQRIIPLYAKRARGLMSHFVISEGIDKAEDLKEFSLDGYTYRAGLSTETEWMFSR